MIMLSSVLNDETKPLHVRNVAGLALKNALSARVCPSLFFLAEITSCLTVFFVALWFNRKQRRRPSMLIDGFRSIWI